MAKARTFIINPFLRRVAQKGSLIKAADCVTKSGRTYEPLPQMSIWALVCEEILDTEFAAEHYERVAAELFRRGISRTELNDMRAFAWETAGWLNFVKMAWDWCSLDEGDIRLAIQWQFDDGEINDAERARRIDYLEEYVTENRSTDWPH
ncbi:MAG TPA: hypothetical protein VFW23_02865 [Tepidisphaeraceae bacterium]|nr:hypothetical protein [Tepidisphaeraceae bacterium]